MKLFVLVLVALGLAGCDGSQAPSDASRSPQSAQPSADAVAPDPASQPLPLETGVAEPLTPPGPGEPGGLPDDRSPLDEGPFEPESAQGAANVVQLYYAYLEAGKHSDALGLRWSTRARSSPAATEFARSFTDYKEYRARVGAPGAIKAASGSLFVEVPVQVFGRRLDGAQFNKVGVVQLRRSNDTPGATVEQRTWQITAAVPSDLLQ
jgi:hypothetical protein